MGNAHRIMGETPANCASSRSHAVFTLTISSERAEETARGVVRQCELTLVDLAGCERMYKNDGEG
ncbi:unnamed protein product [Hapterophycus canaliculatus]